MLMNNYSIAKLMMHKMVDIMIGFLGHINMVFNFRTFAFHMEESLDQ